MIVNTIQVHYNPEAEYENPTWQVLTATGTPFGSLRIGPQVSLLIDSPDTLELIAKTALDLAAELREAQA